MAIAKNNNQPKQAKPAKAPRQGKENVAVASKAQTERNALLSKLFHKSAVEFLKKHLNLDLSSLNIPDSDIWNLSKQNVTRGGYDMTVTPLVYDAAQKKTVEGKPLGITAALQVSFPRDQKTRKPAPVVKNEKGYYNVMLNVVPERPMRLRDDVTSVVLPEDEAVRTSENKDKIEFSNDQYMALEGIGIGRNDVWKLPYDVKADIVDGKAFSVDGQVRTEVGYIPVIGRARLEVKDGNLEVMFRSSVVPEVGKSQFDVFKEAYPDLKKEDLVIDLEGAALKGNFRLDVFARDKNGKLVRDDAGRLVRNEAGRNLEEFGAALMPVMGYSVKSVKDPETGEYKTEFSEPKAYNVSVSHGELVRQPMKFVPDLGEDNHPVITRDRFGKEHQEGHWELMNAVVNPKEAAVYVEGRNEPLKFESAEDMKGYVEGYGGFVQNAVFKDKVREDGKLVEMNTPYRAFVHADPALNGFGRQRSIDTSGKIAQRRDAARREAELTRPVLTRQHR